MPIVYFSSLDACDLVEVTFVGPNEVPQTKLLLVDSGFTGESSFVLGESLSTLALASIAASRASGALQGTQNRILVSCRIDNLRFERNLIVIVTDVTSLSLPPGVDGMAGLQFLRQFDRWGAENTAGGGWRFFLEIAAVSATANG